MYKMLVTKVFILFCVGVVSALPFIYDKTEQDLLIQSRKIGEDAKIKYFQETLGVMDEKKRRDYYLNGLEKCDRIGNERADRIALRAIKESRKADALELRKIGLRHFQAQFTTLPASLMKEVVHMACSKHEQQLQCGAIFEGLGEIAKRIEDLMSIGNHRLMFNHECKDPEFAVAVYPCIARSVSALRSHCGTQMDQYFENREGANKEITKTYETSLNSVKLIKATENAHQDILNKFIFNNAMKHIVAVEGKKCGLFKQMRSCALPVIAKQCGQDAMHTLNTSISLGYLRIERKERLHLDFDVFNIPSDPNCEGL